MWTHGRRRTTVELQLLDAEHTREVLGLGGMGEVYCADDLKLGQPVALKFLHKDVDGNPERLARLFNEVALTRRVAHPNVCRMYDLAELDGHHCLSMEYIEGEDIGRRLHRLGRLFFHEAIALGLQICDGLAALHQQGILHRDLKPSNLLLGGPATDVWSSRISASRALMPKLSVVKSTKERLRTWLLSSLLALMYQRAVISMP